ncbi:centrosomal protein of 135 kDa-like isoform X2 [Macrosteles quadrilineatus]|uniref:centrosomal protein of 135 kDa-like isoform X2 n=1 Tax=Macrosteles quadrilineatus TaxID=74068 RepID=UPI0023E13932|nr:centrosomal protein of 135 kDa-like isoform X2 [Macrosteles quadrilineatus]
MSNMTAKYSLLKRKYNEKEEENLCLREKIREYECNRCSGSGMSQALVTKLEMEREAAKGDCVRLRDENNALRDDIKRLKEHQHCEEVRLEQAKKDFDCCVSQFEVERRGFNNEISRLSEELRQSKDRARELQTEASEQRTRCNHFKMVNEQTERELRTTQDLLHQTEAELASALDRVSELNDELHKRDWELKEARQEKNCLKNNLSRLDQEKDALLLKLDEKTEQNVKLERELENRDHRIASLEGFIADLQKKLDVALDTAARSEHSSRQHTLETDRLRKELDKMERCRDNAVREISRLQNDLASITADHTQTSRCLEAARSEVEDLKLQVQGYVTEVRRITNILEEKEAERTAMLDHFRTLTVESANLESNNHSLESEARSTKSNLREAQTRIQDLEATLEEKKALVHGYEKQIRELTQQVAKLERKLDSQSRAGSATRDLSRELETQKHCLAQQVDQLTCVNKRLEEEVCGLREELSHLQEQLGKERKNSATLEKVLASSRQETLQRTRDNGELQTQVQCLQDRLRDLQDKLEHGSDALRRCQTECADYQAQVTQLKRDVTNERFQRARIDESRKSRSILRSKKRLTSQRSQSLICQRTRMMSPNYVCPCCFLNRISILRESRGSSEVQFQFKPRVSSETVTFEAVETESKTSMSTQQTFSDTSGFNNLSQLGEVMDKSVAHMSNYSNCSNTNYVSGSSMDCNKKSVLLAEQIDCVLKEQKKFLRELNLDIPVNEEEWSMLIGEQSVQAKCGDYDKNTKTNQKKSKRSKQDFVKQFRTDQVIDSYFAGGDKLCPTSINMFGENWKEDDLVEDSNFSKINKPTIYFNEEPVKLPKPFQCTLTTTESDINRDYTTDKNVSVKLLFFPEVPLKGSSTSMLSDGGMSSASVYVTATNSASEQVPMIYNTADSSSNFQLNATQSSATMS